MLLILTVFHADIVILFVYSVAAAPAQAQFQHNELIGARGKIQQKAREMEDNARERLTRLETIRQVAHQSRLKANFVEKQHAQAVTMHSRSKLGMNIPATKKSAWLTLHKQKERLERELNCLVFEWGSFPKFMKEKGRTTAMLTKNVAKLNGDMVQALERQGVVLSEQDKTSIFSLEEATMVVHSTATSAVTT